jgi:superfamily I DNA/RNA helicase
MGISGQDTSEIAVLCLKERTQQDTAEHMQAQGIPVVPSSEYRHSSDGPRVLVGLISGITGQEFEAVFVVDLQDLFDRDSPYFGGSWPEFKAKQKQLLYTAITRTRSHLHLCYRRNLLSTLEPLRSVTEEVRI